MNCNENIENFRRSPTGLSSGLPKFRIQGSSTYAAARRCSNPHLSATERARRCLDAQTRRVQDDIIFVETGFKILRSPMKSAAHADKDDGKYEKNGKNNDGNDGAAAVQQHCGMNNVSTQCDDQCFSDMSTESNPKPTEKPSSFDKLYGKDSTNLVMEYLTKVFVKKPSTENDASSELPQSSANVKCELCSKYEAALAEMLGAAVASELAKCSCADEKYANDEHTPPANSSDDETDDESEQFSTEAVEHITEIYMRPLIENLRDTYIANMRKQRFLMNKIQELKKIYSRQI